jgi:SSS family solute:Na+ symporter
MSVRDFIVRIRPQTPERVQVFLGRLAIVVGTVLGIGAAYFVYKTPKGLYEYLQATSIYLVMPITPAIVFGILSRRVNFVGAAASVLAGLAMSALYMTDAFLTTFVGPDAGRAVFPFLYRTLTLNYTYRGLWGTLAAIVVLFGVSALTKRPPPEKLERTTVRLADLSEPFRGVTDWRLHLAILAAVTVALYWWLW